MNTLNILVIMITIGLIEANDQEEVVLVPELPTGVWDDGKCTLRRMQKMYEECENALGTNATDANRLACNLLKPNALPLGGISKHVSPSWTVGMFNNEDIGYSMFDICIIPRLIKDGAISIATVADSERLKSRSEGLGALYWGYDITFEDSDILSIDDMYYYSEARARPEKLESQYPGALSQRYLYRDYKLKINPSALSQSLSDSLLHSLNTILSLIQQNQWSTKMLIQDKSYQAFIDDYLFAPTEFYLDQGIGSIVYAQGTPYFDGYWPCDNNCTAQQAEDSFDWNKNNAIPVSAKDFLYGGCTLDEVSSHMTIFDAIDACHAASTLKPVELQVTSFRRLVNIFDLLKESAPAKAFPSEFKLVIDSLHYAYTTCACDTYTQPYTADCRSWSRKPFQVKLLQNCPLPYYTDLSLANFDFVESLPF